MAKRIYKSRRFTSREVIAPSPPSYKRIQGRGTLREVPEGPRLIGLRVFFASERSGET